MSLLRLLTAGKSLVGLKDSESRYHLSGPRAMPKFAGKKNPFRATTRPDAIAPVDAAPAEPGPMPELIAPETAAAASEPSAQPAAVPAVEALPAPAAAPATEIKAGRGAGARVAKIFGLLRRKAPGNARPVVPHMTKPMVQGELSLESVKVVRNDLSDTDLELVPARPASRPVAVKSAPQSVAQSAGGAWERMSGRLFGTGKL